jgi:hypothetical protein
MEFVAPQAGEYIVRIAELETRNDTRALSFKKFIDLSA